MQFRPRPFKPLPEWKDSVAWHSDNLPADGKHHHIASVTFGDTRIFKVRHKSSKDIQQLGIPLTMGACY